MKIDNQTTSKKLKEKNKNGDACHVFKLSKPALQVFLLADGVGSCVGDYRASEVAIKQFETHFKRKTLNQSFGNETIENIVKETVIYVNKAILDTEGYYRGMKSTLVVAVIDITNSKLYYTSIGDSRIYKVTNEKVLVLTQDQVKVVMRRKQDGTLITQGDSIVNAVGVTNLLGISSLEVEVKKMDIDSTTSFLLASDGFYDCLSDTKEELVSLHNVLYFQNDFQDLVHLITQNQKDDASAIFVKVLHDDDLRSIQKQLDVFDNLIKSIKNHQVEETLACIKNIETEDLRNSFEFYDTLIKEMIQLEFNSSEVYQKLVELLKKSKV